MSTPADEEEFDLQIMWQGACESFRRSTGADLSVGSGLSVEDVISQIAVKHDNADGLKAKATKEILGNVLRAVQALGNVTAQSAGMVFGPSTLCFNAVSFLITAGQSYKNIFSGLNELFSRISDVLERFRISLNRKDMMDIALRKIIHQLLCSFVRICELSVKVLHGNKGIKFLKVLAFNSDDGVSAELEKLKMLTEKETQMKVTLILDSAKATEHNTMNGFKENREGIKAVLDKMSNAEKKLKADTVEKRQLEAIKRILGDPKESYREMLDEHLNASVKGTGQWIWEDSTFTAWADRQQESEPIFCIVGNEGYGKSFLMSTIVRELRRKYPQRKGDPSRTSIAYYYFQKDLKDSQSFNNDPQSIVTATKAVVMQLAENDPIYQKDLALACGKVEEEDIRDAVPLWNKLMASIFGSDATCFILFDGISQLDERRIKDLRQILADIQSRSRTHDPRHPLRMRLLLTSTVDITNEIEIGLKDPILKIEMALKNKDDLKKFVIDRIDSVQILKNLPAQAQGLRDEILTELTNHAGGDYINVELLVKEIETKRRPAEIRSVLEKAKAGEKRSDTIAREIARCNESLGNDDIQELNELLTWVICAHRSLSIAELEAVLYVKNREISLRPLRRQIRECYSSFLSVAEIGPDADYPHVNLVSESIRDYFLKGSEMSGDNKIGISDEVNESEVKIVKRFIKSVCDDDLFQKFGFDEFFARKLSSSAAAIDVDLETAGFKIILDCLQLISGEDCEQTRPLLQYAVWYFPDHLLDVDLSLAAPKVKTAIGEELLKLFTKYETIERWWTEYNISRSLRWWWFSTDEYVDRVSDWFKDSAVVKSFSKADKEWVKDVLSSSVPEADTLEPIAKFIAGKWLQGSYSVEKCFPIVYTYIMKIGNRKEPQRIKRQKEEPSADSIKESDIIGAVEWAKSNGVFDEPDYESVRAMAKTLRAYKKFPEAIREFKIASTLSNDHWLADWGLATVYTLQEEWQLAADLLETIIKTPQLDAATERARQEFLRDLNYDLAESQDRLGRSGKALEIYRKLLLQNPDDYKTILRFIILLGKEDKCSEMIDFLQEIQQSTDEKTGLDRLTIIHHVLATNQKFHEAIVKAAKRTQCLNVIKEAYRRAIDTAQLKHRSATNATEKSQMVCIFGNLLYYFALALFEHHASLDEKVQAIDLWEQVFQLQRSRDSSNLNSVRRNSGKQLAMVYLDRAKEASPGSDIAAHNINKLAGLSNNKDEEIYFLARIDLLLGRYYAYINDVEQAKRFIGGSMKIAIDLLSDDDPTNDWQGYERLAKSLTFFGDNDNALAAWSLLEPYQTSPGSRNGTAEQPATPKNTSSIAISPAEADESADSKAAMPLVANSAPGLANFEEPPPVTFEKPEGPLTYYCDGLCGVRWTYADDMYFCKDCFDVQFDPKCLRLLRSGRLSPKVCNPDHEFLHVPKYDVHEAAAVGKGNVRVGGKVEPISAWLDGLRREWGLA